MWLIGDRSLQAAYPDFCTQVHLLPTLSAFQFIETHLIRRTLMQQAPFTLLDIFQAHHYLLKAKYFHVGLSDLRVTLSHLLKFVAAQFCNTAQRLISTVQPYKPLHIGIFVSLALPQPWYPGWDSQVAAKCTRARLNGALRHAATQAGGYVVNHPELAPMTFQCS